MNKKGFTLIELLVVVGIIGLLSTLAVVSLNSARGKSRDARRLSDVKQLSTILELEATDGAGNTALIGCATAHALTTTCSNTGEIANSFPNFIDPSGTSACVSSASTPCAYSISKSDGTAGATVSNYQIMFYLEEGTGEQSEGIGCIENGSIFKSGAANCQ